MNNFFTEAVLCHSCANLVNKNQPCPCGANFEGSAVENTRKRKYVHSQLPGIPNKGPTQTQTEAKDIWMNKAPASCHLASAQVHRLSGHHPAGYAVQARTSLELDRTLQFPLSLHRYLYGSISSKKK